MEDKEILEIDGKMYGSSKSVLVNDNNRPLLWSADMNHRSLSDIQKIVDLKAENAELKEIAKSVAHIGIDFGYGKYEIQQKEIDKARELLARSEGE